MAARPAFHRCGDRALRALAPLLAVVVVGCSGESPTYDGPEASEPSVGPARSPAAATTAPRATETSPPGPAAAPATARPPRPESSTAGAEPSAFVIEDFALAFSEAASDADARRFVRLFAPELRERALRWHRNLHTLGADQVLGVPRGAVVTDGGVVTLDMLVGFHIVGIDGADRAMSNPLPGVTTGDRFPGTGYTVALRLDDRRPAGAVFTTWRPTFEPAPWDVGELVAIGGPGFVLATRAPHAAALETYRPAIAAAASHVSAVFDGVRRQLGPRSLLDTPGFAAFVEPDDELFRSYFSSRSVEHEVSGYASGLQSASDTTGGARVVMRPDGDDASFAALAVHEFVHAMYAPAAKPGDFSGLGVDPETAWVHEGLAFWLETTYTHGGTFAGPPVDALRDLVAGGAFPARPPTAEEVRTQPAYAYPAAASVFEWIYQTYGDAVLFETAQASIASGEDRIFSDLQPVNGQPPLEAWAAWVSQL